MLVGVAGGFGVAAREPQGERPARNPGLLSAGPDILSNCLAVPPLEEKLSQLSCRRYIVAPSFSRSDGGR